MTLIVSKKLLILDSIRYLSLHDYKYLRYFKGHRDKVLSICVSPLNDKFVSTSMDETCKLWDLKSTSPISSISVKGPSQATIDVLSKVIAISNSSGIRLYDIRQMDKGPFDGIQFDNLQYGFSNLKFGPRKF